ncbi:hypothetical protein PRK78_002933 [Emydomyces testavorans]|uniref:N-acetyltransferase domain-containing protein n=1 Tax=Emydomyces testavorans TaxID=2070801 RepID=A0AAF0DF70_9EURO|nr:hypothetical protein PRK78_002933 [Emydomyces testavorans]
MTLTLSRAKESDAPRIADIHMAAFGNNAMLLAQFPTPAVREGLWKSLVDKVIAEMRDSKWAILVVLNQKGEVISFAKWCLPVLESENYEEPPWRWPQGTKMAILDEWTEKVEAASEKILGTTPCYRLSFIGTDPLHQGQGAGALLVKWGLDRCEKENVPAILEGTTNANPFYERFGFKSEERILMQLDGVGQDGASMLYEETCFVFRPNAVG